MGDLPILPREIRGVAVARLADPQALTGKPNGQAVLEKHISGHIAALRWP